MARRYEHVWQELKRKKEIFVRVPNAAHARFVKAIFKEKGLDKEARSKWRMEWKVEKEDVLKFWLRARVNLYDL